ncbi:uncharacterized protein [Diadema antillarum]|uniref:uncharacterized protein n=1 Tax=Diadema antillarum TaxID=105358 RepID=UPI003A89D135
MSFTEDMPVLSLFSDEDSLWGQLHEDGGLDTDFYSSPPKGGKLETGLDPFADQLSPGAESGDDPLPDWMSEKVPLSAWLGDEEDIPMADLMTIPEAPILKSVPAEAEALLKELLVEANTPPAEPSLVEEDAFSLPPVSPAQSPTFDTVSASSSPLSSQPPSPMATLPEGPAGGDLEAQALALLDSMGCMDFSSILDGQVITVTLPLQPDQTEQEQEISDPPISPQSIASPSSVQSEDSSYPPSPPPKTPIRRTRTKQKLKNASPIDRKSRKRDQNKQAATRYRVKKREETDTLMTELSQLEDTNRKLKDKTEGLEREIKYLKDLLIEVRMLKGQIKAVEKS